MAIRKNITRTRTNTRRIVVHLSSKSFPNGVDLTSWTGFNLVIDSREAPTDGTTVEQTIIGAILTPATDGLVGFSPDGALATGNYFYNAFATDDNGETFTFAKGTYNVEENIG